ncbi:hypothetical protein HDU77_010734 [Chytriomyces hyalinus]|nr:hypothetical protein HDU77_010734 [Chytriomyces hyalinus]
MSMLDDYLDMLGASMGPPSGQSATPATPNSDQLGLTRSPQAQLPRFNSRAVMDTFGFPPSKQARLDQLGRLSQHELTAGIALLAESINDARALEQWAASFKIKSWPAITVFFYAQLGVTSFTALPEFKSKRAEIFQTLKIVPINVVNCSEDCLAYIQEDETCESPTNAAETTLALTQISKKLSLLRTNLKSILLKLAGDPYNDKQAVSAIYKNDPRSLENAPERLRTARMLVHFAKFILEKKLKEKDYWDYFSAHFAFINEMTDDRKSTMYDNAMRQLGLLQNATGDSSNQLERRNGEQPNEHHEVPENEPDNRRVPADEIQ